jgi:hypothetical protein
MFWFSVNSVFLPTVKYDSVKSIFMLLPRIWDQEQIHFFIPFQRSRDSTVSQLFGWNFGINQSSIKILMSEHVLISARDEPAEDGALQTNAVRRADAAGIFVFY